MITKKLERVWQRIDKLPPLYPAASLRPSTDPEKQQRDLMLLKVLSWSDKDITRFVLLMGGEESSNGLRMVRRARNIIRTCYHQATKA